MDTVSLNLSIPWVPSSNGEVLHPFDRLTEVIESKCTPIPSADKPWLRKAHEEVLSKFPNAAEALWETVLALWRLKITAPDEDSDPDDVLWESHVSAWLVSVSGPNRDPFANLSTDSSAIAKSAGSWMSSRST